MPRTVPSTKYYTSPNVNINNADVEKVYSDMLFEATKSVVIPNPLRMVSVIPRLIHILIYIYNFATKIYAHSFEGTE